MRLVGVTVELRERRRRTPQNRALHVAAIAVSTSVALAVAVWLMVVGRG